MVPPPTDVDLNRNPQDDYDKGPIDLTSLTLRAYIRRTVQAERLVDDFIKRLIRANSVEAASRRILERFDKANKCHSDEDCWIDFTSGATEFEVDPFAELRKLLKEDSNAIPNPASGTDSAAQPGKGT